MTCTCKTCPVHARTVPCGACGASLPRISTKAQRDYNSPEFQARLKHIREECPSRVSQSHALPTGRELSNDGGDE